MAAVIPKRDHPRAPGHPSGKTGSSEPPKIGPPGLQDRFEIERACRPGPPSVANTSAPRRHSSNVAFRRRASPNFRERRFTKEPSRATELLAPTAGQHSPSCALSALSPDLARRRVHASSATVYQRCGLEEPGAAALGEYGTHPPDQPAGSARGPDSGRRDTPAPRLSGPYRGGQNPDRRLRVRRPAVWVPQCGWRAPLTHPVRKHEDRVSLPPPSRPFPGPARARRRPQSYAPPNWF